MIAAREERRERGTYQPTILGAIARVFKGNYPSLNNDPRDFRPAVVGE
jgi:hypothetical protein